MGGNHQPESGHRLTRLGAVVYGKDASVARWVGLSIPGYMPSFGAKALGVIKGGELVAGVVYERCNGFHCEVSISAREGSGWADRRTLFALFHYPFVQLGCLALTVTVPLSNLKSLNLATKLGFARIALIPHAAHDGTPLVVLQMTRDTCIWIGNHGKRQQSTGRT
jgi:hypothetical protein